MSGARSRGTLNPASGANAHLAGDPPPLFPDAGHLHQDVSFPRAVVEVEKDDLLPRPEDHGAAHYGNQERRPEKGRPHMGITVSVPPAGVVTVPDALRRQSPDGLFQILDDAPFELDGRECRRGPRDEEENLPLGDTGLTDFLRYRSRDVDHIRPCGRGKGEARVVIFHGNVLPLDAWGFLEIITEAACPVQVGLVFARII